MGQSSRVFRAAVVGSFCIGLVMLASTLSGGNSEPDRPQRRCGCEPLPYADLEPCPGDGRCVNVKNDCHVTLWAVVTSGSPPTVYGDATLEPGETRAFSNLPEEVVAGRVYLYYKDPAEFGQGRYSVADDGPVPAVPPPSMEYSQLLEFTMFATHRGLIVDYDVSYVDSAALPVLAQAHAPLGGGDSTRPSGKNAAACKRPRSTCDPVTFTKGCPTHVHKETDLGIGQCMSAMKHCEKVFREGRMDALCEKMGRYSKLSANSRGPNECDVCGVLGCEVAKLNRGQVNEHGNMTPAVCMAIHRGLCLGEPPFTAENCPPPGTTQRDWFQGKAPHNDYAEWVRKKSEHTFAFPYDDAVGHSQCISSRLDIVACPMCAN